MKNEKIIDIKEMILFLLLKWRIAFAWIILFAFLMNGFSCFQSFKNRKSVEEQLKVQEQNDSQVVTSNYEQYTSGMSKTDIEKTEIAAENYFMLKKSYNNLKKYCNKSIKMQIDPEAVAVNELNYVLKNAKDLENVYVSFKNDILNDEVSKDIIDKLGWDTDYNYIPELITFSSALTDKDSIGNNTLTIKIIGPDKESVEKIGEVLTSRIEKKKKDYEEEFGNFEVNYLNMNAYVQADSDLLLFQQTYKEKKNGVISLMNSLYNSLDGNQQTYLRALLENEEGALQNNSVVNNTNKNKEVNLPEIQYLNVKYVVLGAILGLLMFVIIYVITYIMDSHLQTAKSITDCFDIPVLGVVNNSEEKKHSLGKTIDSKIKRLFMTKQEKKKTQDILQMVCAEILVYVNKADCSSIYITGNLKNTFVNQVASSLTQNLKNKGIEVNAGSSVIDDADSLLKLSDYEGIVLIEELMKTDRKEISREIELCKRYEVNILGAVVIGSK